MACPHFFFFSSRRRHTRCGRDWSSDVCSSDLARYARIRAGESLATRFEASGEIYYVIAGSGETTWGTEAIGWEAGDVFCLPGGGSAAHRSAARDPVLWIVTNQPQRRVDGAQTSQPG